MGLLIYLGRRNNDVLDILFPEASNINVEKNQNYDKNVLKNDVPYN
jgi:hypothetical protein